MERIGIEPKKVDLPSSRVRAVWERPEGVAEDINTFLEPASGLVRGIETGEHTVLAIPRLGES